MAQILVVDDMAVFREPIAAALRADGFEVICASNGREALEALDAHRPALMLLDVSMPGMNGIDVLRTVRRRGIDSEVILLTSVAERGCVLDARRLGVRHYLLKSQFSMSELVRRVNDCLADQGPVAAEQEVDGAQQAVPPVGSDPIPNPREELKNARSILRRSDVLDRIAAAAELKSFSPVVSKLLQLTQSDRSSMEQIVKTVKQDQGVALRILKLANSAVYTRGAPVESIEKAVTRIGLSQIRQAVLNIGVVESLSSAFEGQAIDAAQYWEHSLACGLIAAQISRHRDGETDDVAFTMGLMHDVGRVMLASTFPEEYAKVIETADRLSLPLEQVETRLLMVNHADCMDRLLHQWGFPKELIDPVVFHHLSLGNARHIAPRRVEAIATLSLANRLAHALLLGSSGNDALYPTDEHCRLLEVPTHVIDEIEDRTREQTMSLRLAMLAHADTTTVPDQRDVLRGSLQAEVVPLYISESSELDGFRLFLRQVCPPSDHSPTIAVVNMPDAAVATHLNHLLCAAELKASVSKLPAIVLTPKPETVSAPAFGGRQIIPVRVPTRCSTLVDTLNRTASTQDRAAA